MSHLSNEERDAIRIRLEEDKTHLVAQIAELAKQDPFSDPERLNDNAATDMEASEESSHDRFVALSEELTQKLARIDEALIRIGNGTYGMCTRCGAAIPKERLSILPASALCLRCEQQKKA